MLRSDNESRDEFDELSSEEEEDSPGLGCTFPETQRRTQSQVKHIVILPLTFMPFMNLTFDICILLIFNIIFTTKALPLYFLLLVCLIERISE